MCVYLCIYVRHRGRRVNWFFFFEQDLLTFSNKRHHWDHSSILIAVNIIKEFLYARQKSFQFCGRQVIKKKSISARNRKMQSIAPPKLQDSWRLYMCVCLYVFNLQRIGEDTLMKWAAVACSRAALLHLQSGWWLSLSFSQMWLKAAVPDTQLKVIMLINCPLPLSLIECSLKIKYLTAIQAAPTSAALQSSLCWKCYLDATKIGSVDLLFYLLEWY